MAINLQAAKVDRPSHLGGNSWDLKDLNHITVIFGKNGAGKSLLLRKLRDVIRPNTHYASPERGGEMSLRPDFVMEEMDSGARGNKRMRNFALTYREEVVARIQAYLAKRGNQRGDSIIESPSELEHILHNLLPDFNFSMKDSNPPYELLRLINQQSITNVNDLSTGETEVFMLALDLLLICAMWRLEGQQGGILLIDEPDSHLHPDLQQHLAKFFVDLMKRYDVQIITSTHSTTLLSALGYHGQAETSVIYLNNSVETQTAAPFNDYMQEIATCLGGHALMGPLFGVPLFLVEGDDDYKIWSQVPRHGIVGLAAIPCDGQKIGKYRDTLETIFSSLLGKATKPSGYVLLDGDKNCSDNKNKHILCLKLNCHESENLYLTDEVLAEIGLDWEAAKQLIKAESSKFGPKKEFLANVDTWDRRIVDVKNYMVELEQIIDPKHVNWALRVGKTIGKSRPQGMLADFLGSDLLTALWGAEVISTEVAQSAT